MHNQEITMAKKARYKALTNDRERIAEANASIARLTHTLTQGDNRFGTYGDNCRAAIKNWEAVLARLGGQGR